MKKTLLLLFIFLISFKANSQEIDGDTGLHAAVGFGIGAATYFVVKKISGKKKTAVIWGVSLATAAGVGKELRDQSICGDCAMETDAIATALGGLAGALTFRFALDGNNKKKKNKKIKEETLREKTEKENELDRIREELKLKI